MKILLGFLLVSKTVWAGAISGHVSVQTEDKKVAQLADDTVVFLDSVPQGAAFDQAKAKLNPRPEMASKNKVFEPHVLPILAGTQVHFPNEDRILHNVFSLSKVHPFDLGLYAKGVSKGTIFQQPGLVKVYCNIHEAMVGYVLVLQNPFFVKTDANGAYKIDGIPDGKYRLVAWHRHSSQTDTKDIVLGGTQEITVSGQKVSVVNFALIEDSRNTKHTNKWGKSYKDKY